MTDCPHCRAPAPVLGAPEHAWDCPARGAPKRFDWDAPGKATDPPLPDTVFTPLPPLASLSADERAELIALARVVEAAWSARAPRTASAAE